jgi:dihydroflavonol-4-reductase
MRNLRMGGLCYLRAMPVLVTGGTGFIGGHVARLLAARGAELRLLVRPRSRLDHIEDLPAERVLGDLRDPASLRAALRGCRTVFHVAADYRLWSPNPQELYESNVQGTANLLDAAAEAGVDRVVYTSTVGAIRPPAPGQISDEDSPVSLDQMSGHYKRSKFMAEQAALERARRGLPVVIVNPTAPVGEADVKPTPTGKIILDFLRGRMPAYIDTGVNVVDVRAVAEGHLLAAERGRIGERYILGDRNMTLRAILETLARLTGRPAPRFRIPYAVAYGFAVLDTYVSRWSGRPPTAPLDAVKMARYKMFVTSAKAERELGYRRGSAEDALARAIHWFDTHGYTDAGSKFKV